MIKFTYDDVRKYSPCVDGFKDATKKLGGKKAWNTNPKSFADLLAAGVSREDIIWLASVHNGDAGFERRRRLWSADCAAHVIHLFYNFRPDDNRPVKAIEASRAFARGEIEKVAFDAARHEAFDAALVANFTSGASYAAQATGFDCSFDITLSAAWAADRDTARGAEREWQVERLILWMGEEEPEDWPVAQAQEVLA